MGDVSSGAMPRPNIVEVHDHDRPEQYADADVLCLRVNGLGKKPLLSEHSESPVPAHHFASSKHVLDWFEKSCFRPGSLVIVFLTPLDELDPAELAEELKVRSKLIEKGANVFDRSETEGGVTDIETLRAMLSSRWQLATGSHARGTDAAVALEEPFTRKLQPPDDKPGPYARFPAQSDPDEMGERLKELTDWYANPNTPWYEMD